MSGCVKMDREHYRYSIKDMDRLEAGVFKTIHAGYDPAAGNADPNVLVPLDAVRAYEKEGKFMAVTMAGSDGEGMKQILGTLKDAPAK